MISDTHNLHGTVTLPFADVLIHAGDATEDGTITETEKFCSWWNSLDYEYKIFSPGNHDALFEIDGYGASSLFDSRTHVLIQSGVRLPCGLFIYGTPFIPARKPGPFTLVRDSEELLLERSRIPRDIDILVTHGPPYNILDVEAGKEPCGCKFLRQVVSVSKPTIHVFGHIHESGGSYIQTSDVLFVNAALAASDKGNIDKSPILIEIDVDCLLSCNDQSRRLSNEDIVSVLSFDT